MSTLLDMVPGKLKKLNPELAPRQQEERIVYLFPRVEARIRDLVATLQSDFEHEISPLEQLDSFLAVFCGGGVIEHERQFHVLHHHEAGIWELKTRDLRLFGWFYRQDIFVWTNLDAKSRLLQFPGMVGGYRDEAHRDRDDLPIDEPKYVTGDKPDDVVSNFRFPPSQGGRAVR